MKLSKPLIAVNFKAYAEVDGLRSYDLAMICQKVSEETGACIAVCPPTVELARVAASVDIPVLSQNVDSKKSGSATGWVTPSMVAGSGAVGTLINHSEHRVCMSDIEICVSACRDADLITVVCADTDETAAEAAYFSPDFIAVEPPDLIGGDVSVTTANPKIVSMTVESVKKVDKSVSVLCGAGVKNGNDVRTALELGADGVLLASGVVKAKDPESVLSDLIKFI